MFHNDSQLIPAYSIATVLIEKVERCTEIWREQECISIFSLRKIGQKFKKNQIE